MASTHSKAPNRIDRDEVRPSGVDGLPFAESVTPLSSAELAELLKEASLRERAVTPIGGGTKLALGNLPRRVDLALSTEGLNRILHYEPTDMTLSVEAGARFADVQDHLGVRGQSLPIDVVDADRATIGGLIATALAGPRRYGSGTLRDLLIGISVAYPDGTIGKAGGLVVKNVTGFDLMRLHLGALGTLGVILSANFKVLPSARSEATLLSEPLALHDAMRLSATARGGRLRPVALEVFRENSAWRCAARFEGRPRTVSLGAEALRAMSSWLPPFIDHESASWWRNYVSGHSLRGEYAVLIRCAVAPKATGALLQVVEQKSQRDTFADASLAGSPGLGAALIGFRGDALKPDTLGALQRDLLAVADTVTVLSAPPALKQKIDVWGRLPDTVSVMRALKAEFDPGNTLNPGRFVDRI